MGYALDMLRLKRARLLLVGGVEELCIQTFLGFYKLGYLVTGHNGSLSAYAPLTGERRGALLGEGAAFVVMEPLELARRRGARIYAEVLGYGSQFHPSSMYRYDPAANGAVGAIRQALAEASCTPEDIDYISACANATKAGDVMELTAIKETLLAKVEEIKRSSEELERQKKRIAELEDMVGMLRELKGKK